MCASRSVIGINGRSHGNNPSSTGGSSTALISIFLCLSFVFRELLGVFSARAAKRSHDDLAAFGRNLATVGLQQLEYSPANPIEILKIVITYVEKITLFQLR